MTYDEFIAQAPRYEPPTDFDAWLKEAVALRDVAVSSYTKAVLRQSDYELVKDGVAPESVVEADGYAGA